MDLYAGRGSIGPHQIEMVNIQDTEAAVLEKCVTDSSEIADIDIKAASSESYKNAVDAANDNDIAVLESVLAFLLPQQTWSSSKPGPSDKAYQKMQMPPLRTMLVSCHLREVVGAACWCSEWELAVGRANQSFPSIVDVCCARHVACTYSRNPHCAQGIRWPHHKGPLAAC